MRLAEVYGVTIDSLVKTTTLDGKEVLPPPQASTALKGVPFVILEYDIDIRTPFVL